MRFTKVALCALLSIASFWLGAYFLHVVTVESWMHFPVFATAFIGFVAGLFGGCYFMAYGDLK